MPMKNTFGTSVLVTIYGESHGNSVGVVMDGLAPGIPVDVEYVKKMLLRRRGAADISTPRRETDSVIFESGVYSGRTSGTPICIRIENTDTKSSDYEATRWLARPSHADYSAYCKYHGYEDFRGGGHFSGRITAGLVAAGAVVIPALERKGIRIATHILRCGGVSDRDFEDVDADIRALNERDFGVLDESAGKEMVAKIKSARAEGNSLGGTLETAIAGLPAGLGEPWFDTVESMIAHMMFSVPAVKGVEFGAGFGFADMTGKNANDPFRISGGRVVTSTNNSGGINGGITNGMPVIFRCAVRPTPTVLFSQDTVDFRLNREAEIKAAGRHDPCIVHRARTVVDCAAALTVCDIIASHYGTDWLGE